MEQRANQLKSISEKEIASITKQVHQQIKMKKKKASQLTQNKEEMNR